jgi:hypothetical protein
MNENPTDAMPQPEAVVLEPVPAGIPLTSDAQQYLNQTGPWVRFMSILLFIGSGLMLLASASLVMLGLTGMSAFGGPFGAGSRAGGVSLVLLGPMYLAMAILIYIVPGVFLFRYASAIKQLRADGSSSTLEDALRQQRSFWRYLGILTLIMLIIAALVTIVAVFFAVFLTMRR